MAFPSRKTGLSTSRRTFSDQDCAHFQLVNDYTGKVHRKFTSVFCFSTFSYLLLLLLLFSLFLVVVPFRGRFVLWIDKRDVQSRLDLLSRFIAQLKKSHFRFPRHVLGHGDGAHLVTELGEKVDGDVAPGMVTRREKGKGMRMRRLLLLLLM